MGRLGRLKASTLRLATNLCGWKTSRKLVVFESDDWGAIRMPGRRAYEQLLNEGIRVDRSPYDRLDCLENRDDFQALMNVIDAHSDTYGRPAVFTFNTVMGNPDFEAIERDGFERFHHQHFSDSYRYYYEEDFLGEWKQAMERGFIRPQFHGREHLNTPLWMADLRAGHAETHIAFRNRFYGLQTKTSSRWQKNYSAAYCAESMDQMQAISEIASEGLALFEQTFGYKSKTFVACNYFLPWELEQHLSHEGVRHIQTQRGYMQPMPSLQGAPRARYRRTGQKNKFGQRYGVRNVLFEPYLDETSDWAEKALVEVNQAFNVGTPAIVCTHRINYVSGMDMKHRDRCLRYLNRFLSGLFQRWPDVEFITSDQLSDLMNAEA